MGSVVAQITRHRLSVLHHTTIAIRLFFIAVRCWLHGSTRDPLFLVILNVVAIGVGLMLTGLFVDRRLEVR